MGYCKKTGSTIFVKSLGLLQEDYRAIANVIARKSLIDFHPNRQQPAQAAFVPQAAWRATLRRAKNVARLAPATAPAGYRARRPKPAKAIAQKMNIMSACTLPGQSLPRSPKQQRQHRLRTRPARTTQIAIHGWRPCQRVLPCNTAIHCDLRQSPQHRGTPLRRCAS